jgi:hypothetical protein
MSSAIVDAAVAGRLAIRAFGRRLRGEIEPAPDRDAFRRDLDQALAALPAGLVSQVEWIDLPAQEPPWHDSGIELSPGDELTWLALGRVYASKPLDIWVGPKNQIWARIGKDGRVFSSTRDSHTVVAERAGRLQFGNYFPNDWADVTGSTLQDDAVYESVEGGTLIAAIRWTDSALAGLDALRRIADPQKLVSGEIERFSAGTTTPEGWHYLWHLGDAEIFRSRETPDGGHAIDCSVQGDVGILQRKADLPLTPQTRINWRWQIRSLPGLMREDSLPSHDYLSIAVEFDDGRDITYYWSRSLALGTGYNCPLPNWKHREFHVVVRSGEKGLGVWHDESRNLHADYAHYIGTPPARVVRVWLIANSIFARQLGRCSFASIQLSDGERTIEVL